MQRVHRHLIAFGPDVALGPELHQPAGGQIGLNHPERHAAPTQAGFQKGVFGAQVGKAPGTRCQHSELPPLGKL